MWMIPFSSPIYMNWKAKHELADYVTINILIYVNIVYRYIFIYKHTVDMTFRSLFSIALFHR